MPFAKMYFVFNVSCEIDLANECLSWAVSVSRSPWLEARGRPSPRCSPIPNTASGRVTQALSRFHVSGRGVQSRPLSVPKIHTSGFPPRCRPVYRSLQETPFREVHLPHTLGLTKDSVNLASFHIVSHTQFRTSSLLQQTFIGSLLYRALYC